VANYEGIIINSKVSMDKEMLDTAVKLEFIGRLGSGMEIIDLGYAAQKGVAVHGAPEGNCNAVAEHALGMLLALANNFLQADREVRQKNWQRERNRGFEIMGRTVGIIGFGHTGSQFAKKLSGIGVEILAYDKYKTISEPGVENVALETLYKRVNVISFHVPETEETISMGDHAFFSRFQQPLIVLNICRGKVVETDSLVLAMKQKRVLSAALDVLEYESKSFESFFESELPEAFIYLKNNPNVILTPHIAGWTKESYFGLSNVLADKITEAFS